MSEELEVIAEARADMRHKKYRRAYANIDRLLNKQPHFYAKEIVPLLLLQIDLLARLLIKNVFKRQPYKFEFVRTMQWRILRNLSALEQLLVEYAKPEMSIHTLLRREANQEMLQQEVALLLAKITLEAQGSLHSHISSFLEMLLFGCFALCLSFKQHSRWREGFRCIKLAHDTAVSLKGTKDCRVLERIVEVRLQYAAFLNELREYELALQTTDEALLNIVDLFCAKYSLRELKTRKRQYKYERLWKQIIVCLCLNIDSQGCMSYYDRAYQSMGFLEAVLRQSSIDSYAFKKCVHVLTDEPTKMLERHFERVDQLRKYATFYYENLLKQSPKDEQPPIMAHFTSLMYDRYKQQRLDRQVIALYQPQQKQTQQKQQRQRRNKRSCHAVSNHLESDECMTAMEEDLFQHVRNHNIFRQRKNSTKNNTSASIENKPNNFLRELQQPKPRRTPSRHSFAATASPSNSNSLDVSNIIHADEKFFRKYIENHSGLVIPPKPTPPPLGDELYKKHFTFVKKQFKMRSKENLEDRSDSFLNLHEQKLKIKQEGAFIFSQSRQPAPPASDTYVKKDEHGVVVPLTGIKLFVEIILQNRVMLNLNKLHEKHEQVKKKRENEIKLKKKNDEREQLGQLYRLEESNPNEEFILRLNESRNKRRGKLYKEALLSEKVRQQLDFNNRSQQMLSLAKKIAHENEKSQLIIKKFSERAQDQLREEPHAPQRKLKRSGVLCQRFDGLRQSIVMERFGASAGRFQ